MTFELQNAPRIGESKGSWARTGLHDPGSGMLRPSRKPHREHEGEQNKQTGKRKELIYYNWNS